MSQLLYYDSMTKFKEIYYKDLLTTNNLIDTEKYVSAMKDEEGNDLIIKYPYCYVLEKEGKKYLLPSQYKRDLPIKINKEQKVAFKNEAYYYITDCHTERFKAQQKMTFKQMLDLLTSLDNSNKEHQTILGFIGIASMMDRLFCRVSTPAGFGKDSIVDICGTLFGDAHTIESPTIAKLEYMTIVKWLAINEVVDLAKPEWRIVQDFLLKAGASKNTITKHSRAKGGVGELLKTDHLSMALFYNDIDHYLEPEEYFDRVTKKAVRDRFIPIRLHGSMTENFNSIIEIDVEQYVKENKNTYIDIIRTFEYYKRNYLKEMHHYTFEMPSEIPDRWKTNLGRLLRIIDLYSDNQEEFNKWTKILLDSVKDYKDMLKYYTHLEQAIKKFGETSDKYKELIKRLKTIKTFTKKNNEINETLQGKVSYKDKFWE